MFVVGGLRTADCGLRTAKIHLFMKTQSGSVEFHQYLSSSKCFPCLDIDFLDAASQGRGKYVVHLHGLEGQQGLALLYLVFFLTEDLCYGSLDEGENFFRIRHRIRFPVHELFGKCCLEASFFEI